MKVLLVGFTKELKNDLKNRIMNTSFSDSVFYEAIDLDSAKIASNWDLIDTVLYHTRSKSDLDISCLEEYAASKPVIVITEENYISNGALHSFQSNINYLPATEVTDFVVESCLNNAIEKLNAKKNLDEIKRVQSKLEKNEKRYRILFENSAIGLYEIDLNGNFVLANQVFLDILGLNKIEDLSELNAFQTGISTNGKREKLKELLDQYNSIDNFEDEWLKANKTKITVKENIRPLRDSNNKVTFYQGVVEDITDRKNVEKQLVQSKKDAEKSDRLKSEFLTQISHEIRTPVNTLLSFSSLIKDDLGDSLSIDLIDSFKHMDKAGKRIIRTIDLLIKMSELHTDNYEPNFKENDLYKLLEEIINNYKPLAKEKSLDLQYIKSLDNAKLIFDWATIWDVFSNLIDNAIKFCDEGTVKIYVSKSLMNKVTVTIIDTGIGISEEYVKNIFSPFTQETNGYTRKFDGNGLGLSLVKEYCNLNNTEIFVSSKKGTGSNFTVIFK